ncbi:MAG TPA: hypothetical protein VLQ93_22880, partial [Myxococcaceae bacterium]|nr:hypothetical protein [Myxococcaceae bacterium]
MPTDLHIVASCTDRKRAPFPDDLRLRTIHAPNMRTRARHWWSHLREHPAAPTQVRDLYAGDHWRVILGLPTLAESEGALAPIGCPPAHAC